MPAFPSHPSLDMSMQNPCKYQVIKADMKRLAPTFWLQGGLLQSGVTSKSPCASHSPAVPLASLDTSASSQLCCHTALPAKLLACWASARGSWGPAVTAPEKAAQSQICWLCYCTPTESTHRAERWGTFSQPDQDCGLAGMISPGNVLRFSILLPSGMRCAN